LVKLVDVVEQTVVLFFCFDESCDDLIDVSDARALLDDIKSLSYYASVSDVQVQHAFLLFVFVFDVFKSYFENLNGVEEFLGLFPVFRRHLVFSFVIFHLAVAFLELFLKLLDFQLKLLLSLLTFGFERKNLVVNFVSSVTFLNAYFIGLLGCLLELDNLIRQFFDRSLSKLNLLSHDVYLYFKSLVVTNCVVESDLLVLNLVVKAVKGHFFLVLVFFGRNLRFDVVVDFSQLGQMLLANILKNKFLLALML